MVISWFETNDVFQRVSVLFLIACLFGFTTNITQAFDTTWSQLIAFYMTARLYMGVYFVLVAFLVPMVRGVMIMTCCTVLVSAAFWIGSIYVAYPHQLILIWIAIFIDLTGYMFHWPIAGIARRLGPKGIVWAEDHFGFYPGEPPLFFLVPQRD